jgi:hypothetical protein
VTTPSLPRRQRRDDTAERFNQALREMQSIGLFTTTREEIDAKGNRKTVSNLNPEAEDAWLIEHGIIPAEFRHWYALSLLTYPSKR